MLIKGLCVKNYPKTLLRIGLRLGQPISYFGERNGAFIHDIYSNPSNVNEKSSLGSKVPLSFHTEMAFHHIRPSYVLLLCIEASNRSAITYTVRTKDIINKLNEDEKDILSRPYFLIHPPISYKKAYLSEWRPILRNKALVLADHCNTDFLNDEAQLAYGKVISLCQNHKQSFYLEKGDLLIIDNKRFIHGRSAYDDPKRILKRLYIL